MVKAAVNEIVIPRAFGGADVHARESRGRVEGSASRGSRSTPTPTEGRCTFGKATAGGGSARPNAVRGVHCEAGRTVTAGDLLVEFEAISPGGDAGRSK